MLTIAGPRLCAARDRARSNQSVAEFQCMALVVAAQVLSGATSDRSIGRYANEGLEQRVKRCVLGRAGSSPQFGSADR